MSPMQYPPFRGRDGRRVKDRTISEPVNQKEPSGVQAVVGTALERLKENTLHAGRIQACEFARNFEEQEIHYGQHD
jgi:hypothetical protein